MRKVNAITWDLLIEQRYHARVFQHYAKWLHMVVYIKKNVSKRNLDF